jgi:two-component system chemotaxis sensor kinase CheA
MSIDLSRFHQGFFDEVEEHIENIEALLLAIDVGQPENADFDGVFRAAHSIKGGSGTFGFVEMAKFTHVLESVLDKLRRGDFGLTFAMVDIFLRACDVLKAQLAAYRAGTGIEAVSPAESIAELEAVQAAPAAVGSAAILHTPAAQCFTLELTAAGDAEARAANYTALFGALAEMGPLTAPPGQSADASLWCFTLTADVSEASLRELLAFIVDDPADVRMSIAGAAVTADPPAVEAFGFFDAAPDETAPAPESFGFFEDAPGGPQTAPEAYGFFPDAAGAPGVVAAVGAAAPAAAKTAPPAAAAGKDADSTIRVSLGKIDGLINLVGEMVIAQSRLERISNDLDHAAFADLQATVAQMQHNMRDLQQGVMSIRMLPLRSVFDRFPRMVRELASKLGKSVRLATTGEETVLDKILIEQLADPLTHLIRNGIDHGIESPAARVAAGKPAEGSISLRAWHQGGEVMIEIGDDGGGLNREKILQKAAEKGLPCAADMPQRDVWQLIFAPGFSTAETVTDVSGRGVGMDVVMQNITRIGGRIDIDSHFGFGTRVTIRLPLTLAILDGLSVNVGGELYLIPLTNIIESLQPAPDAMRTIAGGGRIIHIRDEYFPIVALADVLPSRGTPPPRSGEGILVLLEAGNGRVALLVDELEGQHQVVIKSLETNFRHVPGIAGATVMGNGRVALILDVASFVRQAGARAAA